MTLSKEDVRYIDEKYGLAQVERMLSQQTVNGLGRLPTPESILPGLTRKDGLHYTRGQGEEYVRRKKSVQTRVEQLKWGLGLVVALLGVGAAFQHFFF